MFFMHPGEGLCGYADRCLDDGPRLKMKKVSGAIKGDAAEKYHLKAKE